EFTHGTATTDAGNEHADKWRPADPPGPVEGSPALAEVGIVATDRIGQRRQIADVGTQVTEEALQDTQGRAEGNDEQQQQERQADVDFGQTLHTLVDPGHHRPQRHYGDRDDQQYQRQVGTGYAKQQVHPGAGLLRTQPQRGN